MTHLLLGMETDSKEIPEEWNPKYMKVQKNWQQLVVCRQQKERQPLGQYRRGGAPCLSPFFPPA